MSSFNTLLSIFASELEGWNNWPLFLSLFLHISTIDIIFIYILCLAIIMMSILMMLLWRHITAWFDLHQDIGRKLILIDLGIINLLALLSRHLGWIESWGACQSSSCSGNTSTAGHGQRIILLRCHLLRLRIIEILLLISVVIVRSSSHRILTCLFSTHKNWCRWSLVVESNASKRLGRNRRLEHILILVSHRSSHLLLVRLKLLLVNLLSNWAEIEAIWLGKLVVANTCLQASISLTIKRIHFAVLSFVYLRHSLVQEVLGSEIFFASRWLLHKRSSASQT